MTASRWHLFRLLGTPVGVHPSWVVVAALLAGALAGAFAADAPGHPPVVYAGAGVATSLAFFACVVFHELGHAVVARATGTPVRGITLFLFGGLAELDGEPESARDEFLTAVAGPAVSAALAAGFAAAAGLVGPGLARAALEHLAGVNLAVLAFNLVPAFPLDGGRVLRSAVWGATGDLVRATRWAAAGGRAFAAVLVVVGVAHLLAGEFVPGVWLGLIGLFLGTAARTGYQQVLARQLLAGEPVFRFMTPDPVAVPAGLPLRDWVDGYVYRFHRASFPVVDGGRLGGVIATPDLARFPRADWPSHTVGEAMRSDLRGVTVPPDADAYDALGRMDRAGADQLLVAAGDRLVGVVGRDDLLGFLELKLAIDHPGH